MNKFTNIERGVPCEITMYNRRGHAGTERILLYSLGNGMFSYVHPDVFGSNNVIVSTGILNVKPLC